MTCVQLTPKAYFFLFCSLTNADVADIGLHGIVDSEVREGKAMNPLAQYV